MATSLNREITDLQAKIIELQTVAAKLKEQEKRTTFEQHVAIALHENNCSHNHNDGCGWLYDIHDKLHDWSGNSHQQWWAKAETFVKLLRSQGGISDSIILTLAQRINFK